MGVVIFSLVGAFLALLAAYLYDLYTYWDRRGVPHEQPWPFQGTIRGVGRTVSFRDVHQRVYARFKGQSPFAGLSFLTSRPVFLMDLDLIKNVLIKDFAFFKNRGMYHNVHDDPLTGHLFALDGDEWNAMRHKMSPVFSSGKMKFMFSTVVGVGDIMAHTCGEWMDKDTEGVVELKELCARFTTDVIGTTAFGIECNSLKDPNAEFRLRGKSIFDKPRHTTLVRSFMFAYPDFARRLHLKMFTDEVSGFFMNVVRQTVNYRLQHKEKRNDFMELLIALRAEDEVAPKHSDNIDLSHGLTLEQIAAQTLVFFIAGFDTSSTTMAFTLYELAQSPEVQEHLRDEINTAIQENDGELTYEAMTEMRYLDQVFSETLRKYPVLPHLARKTIIDYPVPNSKHIFRKGTPIIIPIDAIHHDPNYYPEPQRYDPDRFTPEATQARHPCAYLPFGDGPRNCIGMRFGKMQTKIGLIKLLQRYKFSVSSRTEIPIELSKQQLIIAAKGGIYLQVEKL